MSANVLDVLILEDSVDDAALVLAQLERNGYAPVFERVETKEEFLDALQSHWWDVVIADWVLPQFSGVEALQLFRQEGFHFPFIMVSGVHGEEMAVAAMKAGANDYILKENLSRLVPALERELETFQSSRRHQRAIGAMQYLAAIVESSEDAIYGKTLDGIIVSWNPAAERLFGYAAEEIVGQPVARLFPSGRADEMSDILNRIRDGRTVGIRETERLQKGGECVPVALTVSPIQDLDGKIIGASSIVHDLSLLKQKERELEAALVEREAVIAKLEETMSQMRTLRGLLPVCAFCHKIRNDEGTWERFESYISRHSEVDFTHGFCPECNERHYGVKPSPVKLPQLELLPGRGKSM